MITVFTPTYNRAYILEKLYNSLVHQTSYNFEWIIVDDGSIDNTFELVDKWQKKTTSFNIIYVKTINGGKHRAINIGVKIAKGEAFFIVDSDDKLTSDAVEFVDRHFSIINNDPSFAGISGMRIFSDGRNIGGNPLIEDYVDATNFERLQYNLTGDKAEVYKTEVLRRFPFPEFKNENFLTEEVVWNALANEGLKLRWYSKPIYICEYLEDGLTNASYRVFYNNPCGWAINIVRKSEYGLLTKDNRQKELMRFVLMEKNKLSDAEIMKLLCIDQNEMDSLNLKCSMIIGNIEDAFVAIKGRECAIAGYGAYGHLLKDILLENDYNVKFVIDKKYESIRDIDAYAVEEFPDIDLVFVAMKNVPEDYIFHIKCNNNVKKIVCMHEICESVW